MVSINAFLSKPSPQACWSFSFSLWNNKSAFQVTQKQLALGFWGNLHTYTHSKRVLLETPRNPPFLLLKKRLPSSLLPQARWWWWWWPCAMGSQTYGSINSKPSSSSSSSSPAMHITDMKEGREAVQMRGGWEVNNPSFSFSISISSSSTAQQTIDEFNGWSQ